MILDTCTLLWLVSGGGRLSQKALFAIEAADEAAVSAISAFEIALKNRAGKLTLPLPPELWFMQSLRHHRLNIIPISAEIAIKAAVLPAVHKDPADRFIIATALICGYPVVTADSVFSEYGIEVIS